MDNLIDNAIKYADPDSVFHVELSLQRAESGGEGDACDHC